MNRNRIYFKIVSVLVLIALGYMIGWIDFGIKKQKALNNIVAVSWGDGEGEQAFYGAYVFLVPEDGEYSVHAEVYIGRSTDYVNYFHDCGEIGRAKTDIEAVEKWGTIYWKEDGLYIGDPSSGGYHLPRSELESHR